MLKSSPFFARLGEAVLILLATLVAYAASLDNYWIKDDLLIRQFTSDGVFDWGQFKLFLWPDHMEREQFWRPIPIFFGFLDYQIWGLRPFGFHLQNTLWQALNGILLAACVRAWLGPRAALGGFLAGLALVLNPGGAEAVIWTLQRMVLMNAAFSLLALLAWKRAASRGGMLWRIAGLVFLICAILSKEIGVVIPGLFFLIDLTERRGNSDESFAKRVRRALIWALPNAGMLAAYFAARYALWGRFDLKYAGLEPAEYAAQNRVFERLPESIGHAFAPVNEAVFGAGPAFALRAAMAACLASGLLFLVAALRTQAPLRRLATIFGALGILSFLPTVYIFWIDQNLFNARLAYFPALAFVGLVIAGTATWLYSERAPLRRLAAVTLLGILLCFGVSLGGSLVAFEAAGHQVAEIQRGILEHDHSLSERDPARSSRRAYVVFDTPSVALGVPTLETSLASALIKPLSPRDLASCPLRETFRVATDPAQARVWWERLRNFREQESLAWEDLEYLSAHQVPPGVTPLFDSARPEEGESPPRLQAPADGLAIPNDTEAPTFVIELPSSAVKARLSIETNTRRSFQLTMTPGINARIVKNEVEGRPDLLAFDLRDGDPERPELATTWQEQLAVFLPAPVPLLWSVEAIDADGRVVGRSASRRLVVVNVIPAP